jgi:hypothetical protein
MDQITEGWTKETIPRGDSFIITFLCNGEARGAIVAENREELNLWNKMTENLNALSVTMSGKN